MGRGKGRTKGHKRWSVVDRSILNGPSAYSELCPFLHKSTSERGRDEKRARKGKRGGHWAGKGAKEKGKKGGKKEKRTRQTGQ